MRGQCCTGRHLPGQMEPWPETGVSPAGNEAGSNGVESSKGCWTHLVPIPGDPAAWLARILAVAPGEPVGWHCCPHAHSVGTQRLLTQTPPCSNLFSAMPSCHSLHFSGETSGTGRHSPSPLAPWLPLPALLLPRLPVEKYPGLQAGCIPQRQPAPPAPHPRHFPGVIFSRLAAKRAAERPACLAVFAVWPPAPAHTAPPAHRPNQMPAPRRQDPGEDEVPGAASCPRGLCLAWSCVSMSLRPSVWCCPAACSHPTVTITCI